MFQLVLLPVARLMWCTSKCYVLWQKFGKDVLLPPDVWICWEEPEEENSLAQSSQDLTVDSGNVDETEVSSGILPEKAQERIEDSSKEYYFMSE
ncbi:hypothetical protein TNCV_4949741 [Trichonephila clavipes]|nr:hypothetical protein TNCV_4949741 [Trichonephila clavipes]